MELVCIPLETASKFTQGAGMKLLICFTWVPSDGKSHHFVPYCWAFNHWRIKWPEVWYPTTSPLKINSIWRDTLSDCHYYRWQLDLYIFVLGKNPALLRDLYLPKSYSSVKKLWHMWKPYMSPQWIWWLKFDYKPVVGIEPNSVLEKWFRLLENQNYKSLNLVFGKMWTHMITFGVGPPLISWKNFVRTVLCASCVFHRTKWDSVPFCHLNLPSSISYREVFHTISMDLLTKISLQYGKECWDQRSVTTEPPSLLSSCFGTKTHHSNKRFLSWTTICFKKALYPRGSVLDSSRLLH